MMPHLRWLAALALSVAVLPAVCAAGMKPYNPVINPADFVAGIDNPFMPLVPGTTFVYRAETPDGTEINNVFVTHDTKQILGVTCTVVHDTVMLDGVLTEDTFDWFAQNKSGSVWYFGEDSKELSGGVVVSTEGSWEAGVDGALPGIVMQAIPRKGAAYRQEFAADVAEDMAKVLRLNGSASVPYGDFDDLMITKEWSPLERGAIEQKYYAEGLGLILTRSLKGGTQRSELIDVLTESASLIVNPVSATAAVPEPDSLALLGLLVPAMLSRRR